MAALARLVELILWVVVMAWAVRRLFAWLVRPPRWDCSPRPGPRVVASPGVLHRDPLCGTYVAEEIAVPLAEADGILYFCSEQCRARYLARRQQASSA